MTPADSQTEYAYWLDPDGSTRIQYSLGVFHELDFQVNEGYRRIPHGGIEIGGILWGRRSPEGISIEAFRQIECEHASGPSFLLSERDIAGIAVLLKSAHQEDELRNLEPLGWFIAHTRGPLNLTDRELSTFDRFFPEPGKITVLVKPERFQPTRFGFLVRKADGTMPRDAASSAIILPLPGRAGKGVVASIPAPTAKSSAPQPPAPPKPTTPRPDTPVPNQTPTVQRPRPEVLAETLPATPIETLPKAEPPVPLEPPPSITPDEPRRRRAEQFRGVVDTEISRPAPLPIPPASSTVSSATRLFFLLLLAAALGCAAGYWAYLQLPSPYIPVQAQKRSTGLLVQWPAEQTRNVEYAAVRVDDGPPQLLTVEQKEAGELEIQPRSESTKVEIIAQHWIRDSRGIIRYLSAPPRVQTPRRQTAPNSAAPKPVLPAPEQQEP